MRINKSRHDLVCLSVSMPSDSNVKQMHCTPLLRKKKTFPACQGEGGINKKPDRVISYPGPRAIVCVCVCLCASVCAWEEGRLEQN